MTAVIIPREPPPLSTCGSSSYMRFHAEKPIVRSPAPHHFNKWLSSSHKQTTSPLLKNKMLDEAVNELCHRRIWTTTATRTMRGSSLPIQKWPLQSSTLESQTNPVSSSSRRYCNTAMFWQRISKYWDSMQVREPLGGASNDNLKEKEEGKDEITSSDASKDDEDTANCPSSENFKMKFCRPVPSYGGHIPKHPRPTCVDNDENDESTLSNSTVSPMISTSRQTYRKFPPMEYSKSSNYYHDSPFTKTVTLIYPYNPFNKILKPLETHNWF